MPDLLRTEANERIDLNDWSFTTIEANDSAMRWLNDQLVTNPLGANRTWILQGFTPSYTGVGQQVQVVRGVAILAYKSGGVTKFGALCAEGDTSRVFDITSYANGTYGIYLRFEYIEGNFQNRVFWNPSGLGSEFAKNISTRQQANWSARIELSSPGAEWTKIGEVVRSGGAPVVTDQRNFYFEGKVSDSYVPVWGGGNDRNADRKVYGIKDLQTFTDMVRAQITAIFGGTQKWWELPSKSLYALWQQLRISQAGSIGMQHRFLGLRSIDDTTQQADLHRTIQGYLGCCMINAAEPIQMPGTVTFINHLAANGTGFATNIVGVGKAGHIVHSSNAGRTWTQRTPPSTVTAYYDICWYANGGLFVAVGENAGAAVIHTSPDGVTWTARTSPYSKPIRAVASHSYAFGSPAVVAVGGAYDSSLGLIVHSTNGITWTQRTPDITYSFPFFGVAARGFPTPRWAIVSHQGQSYQTSDDGLTWTHRVNLSGGGQPTRMRLVGGFMSLFTGIPGYYSTDGITWTSHYLRGTDVLQVSRNWTYGGPYGVTLTCTNGPYDSDGIYASADPSKGFKTVGIWGLKDNTGMCPDGVGGILLGGDHSGYIHHMKGVPPAMYSS